MFNRLCLLAVLSLSCFSAQGAKPIAVPVPVAQDLPVELIESQQEIAVSVPQTASAVGMQFGLIGAIVGSAIQNSQAKKAEWITPSTSACARRCSPSSFRPVCRPTRP
jgi:hypothetical protein